MTVWTPVGNAPVFKITPKFELLDYWDSQTGTKTLAGKDIVSRKGELEIMLYEVNKDNLLMALLGTLDTAGTTMDLLSAPQITRQVKLEGTNDVGARVEIILPNVFLLCDKAVDFIGDKYAEIDLSAELLRVNGSFGTLTFLDTALHAQPLSASNPLNRFIGKGIVSTAPVA